MYGLQTAPSPRRANCKIQRNIKYKEDDFFFWGGGEEILDENLNWNSHNNSRPNPYPRFSNAVKILVPFTDRTLQPGIKSVPGSFLISRIILETRPASHKHTFSSNYS